MISAIRHTGLVVSDLEAALHFWCNVLGFKVKRRLEESGPYIDAMMGLVDVRVTTVKLAAADDSMIELLQFHSHPDKTSWIGTPYSTGFTHIALTVDNLDATVRQLSAAGVKFPASPQVSPDGFAKVIYGKGPEGVLIEFVEMLNS